MDFQLEIVKIVPPGDGLGYHENKAVFVPCTTIGDVVEVSAIKVKKRHILATLKKIITPGKDRVEAPCPHYQDCGGCSFLHLPYKLQLDLKQKLLVEIFSNHQLPISPKVIPSPQPTHYRNRTSVKLKDGIVGFSARHSHNVVAIDECLILSQGIKDKLTDLKNLGRNNCEFSLLESAHNGEVAVCVSENNRQIPLPGHSSQVEENYGFGPLVLRSDGFAQANPLVTSAICHVLENEISADDRVCELYCGSGTFSLPLAKKAKSLNGFDISTKAIQIAKINGQNNKLENTQFHAINLEKGFKLPECNVIVVDPPRKGLGPIPLKRIGNAKASKLLYVSCNPTSFARDAKVLRESYNYNLLSVTGFDMYCHSHHTETLAVFLR